MPNLLQTALLNRATTEDGAGRRMGVEIELAGIEPADLAAIVQKHFNGDLRWTSPFEIIIDATEFGDFKLELDSQQIKDIGEWSAISGDPSDEPSSFSRSYIEAISSLATNLVPWEIVTPPITLESLPRLYALVEDLRASGAKGTRNSIHFAFGVHLNPELTALDSATIVRHLRSFFCLYDWIREIEQTDLARRVTPYINHFDNDYIKLVLDSSYQPDTSKLIDDYLLHNPTRNRSLDMLPLFAYLDLDRVTAAVDDERVNARPTFHYRLPNCDIDNPKWNLDLCVEMWMAVEALAAHDSLPALANDYLSELDSLMPTLSSQWSKKAAEHLAQHELVPTVVANLNTADE